MNNKNFPHVILFLSTLGIVILTTEVAFAQDIAFSVPNSINENLNTTEIPNLLAALGFIAWLVESFLEIIQKPFNLDMKKADTSPTRVSKTHREMAEFTAKAGFGIGLIVYLSGVQIMGILFDFSEGTNIWQKVLFMVVDAILTAAVIAGGSQGIHKLASAYKEVMQTLKQNTKSQTETDAKDTTSANNSQTKSQTGTDANDPENANIESKKEVVIKTR